MASSEDSIPPAWKELEPFRSTFLRHIHEPETADALRKTGAFLFAAALEVANFTPPSEGSEVVADLAAVAADLRYLQEFLARVVAGAVGATCLSPSDSALAFRGGPWAVQLGVLAAEIEEALAP